MSQSTTDLALGALTRTILYSRNFERDLAWYQRVLGLQLAYPAEGGWAEFRGAATGTLCLHEGGGEASAPSRGCASGWRVQDLDAARRHLQAQRIAVTEPRAVCEGLRCIEFADPSGNALFLEGA